MGPGAGTKGGWVVAEGTPEEIKHNVKSLTGQYLNGSLSIAIPSIRRKATDFIEIQGASEHNLKNIDVKIPLKLFTCVTGVSGSGKSTLIFDILYEAAHNSLSRLPARQVYLTEKIHVCKRVESDRPGHQC